MNPQCDIGLIGLAVMGQNLILNMADHGFQVAAFNRTVQKVDEFMAGPARGKTVVGCRRPEELVRSLKRPRRLMLMVKAGEPVDQTIRQFAPLLEAGDIIIDGGNSYYLDTERRIKALSCSQAPEFPAGRKARGTVRALCPADLPVRGPTSSPSFRELPPRSVLTTIFPAVNGSVPAGPAIMSKWSTTASSTATCS
jgi:6-phosphogluconate dehydrogenase